MKEYGFNTTLLHGTEGNNPHGATQVPIYQSSAFRHDTAEELEKIFSNKMAGYSYTRINNPTIESFEKRMAKLEGGIGSVACSSGMAALSMALMNVLQRGDHVVAAAGLYGGTVELLDELKVYGVTTTYVKVNTPQAFEAEITPETRAVFAETIGNPKLDVVDIRELAEMAHENGLPLVMDNTVATAYLVRPLELGADIVVNSTSKYVNGNSDAISGVITDSGNFKWDKEKYPGMKEYAKFGKFAFTAKLRNGLFRNTGACMAPQTAFYNMLGLETLGLRMERACFNAEKLAEFLTQYPDIKVNYPALPDSPWHETAEKTLEHGYGAILTIRVGSKERAFQIMNDLKLPKIVSNIGDTKSLIIHPESTLNAHSTEKEKEDAGVFDDLIRISVGIEDIQDIIEDFKYAIEKK